MSVGCAHARANVSLVGLRVERCNPRQTNPRSLGLSEVIGGEKGESDHNVKELRIGEHFLLASTGQLDYGNRDEFHHILSFYEGLRSHIL